MSVNMKIPGIILLTSFLTGTVLLNSCIKDPTLPVLKTEPVTEITINSVKISGKISDDGGAEVTARGFCWGTASNPTIEDEVVPAGKGPGEFTGNIEGLEPNTLYYARAYAENSVGIAYGNEIVFVTSTAAPAVTTAQVSGITASTAVCGGIVTYDGGGSVTGIGVCWSTTPEPDLSDPFTSEDTGSASFTSQMTNLAPVTTYYVRAYVKNSAGTVYGEQIVFTTKLADVDGNLYNTVKIGAQLWMTENLRVTKLNENTPIPEVTDNNLWIGSSVPAYCWYNNDIANKPVYGALYNWYAVNSGKLCPSGWHVPTDEEFNILEQTLGMGADQLNLWGWRGTDQGTQLKNVTGWSEGGNGTNSSGFSALPGGYRFGGTGEFFLLTTITYWWTATEHDADRGWYRRLDSSSAQVYRASTSKKGGKYIRCVKN
jgi:uncharacterized protein (TIGR02145 family)